MVKLKCYTFQRAAMQVQINHLPLTCIGREKGQDMHKSQKWRMRSSNVMLLWWRHRKGSSKKEPWIRETNKRRAEVVQNFATRDPLQRICSSVWEVKRSVLFSFSFNEVTNTRQKKVFIFRGTLTLTNSYWVNKLQRINSILEQGTSESYNKTGLDGKTGVKLASVHRLVWCLHMAFLSPTPGPPPTPTHNPHSFLSLIHSPINSLVKFPVP